MPARASAPACPTIREWTEEHYDFAGYVTGFDPGDLGDRAALGYRDDEQVCIVTVGGSGVGGELLRRVIEAFPEAKERVPDLRMIVVAGPRIDPATLPQHDGLEVRAYVHDLYRHLAACDLAIVQGGLTTSMELTATGGRSSTSRSAITSSRTSTSATGSSATGPGAAWTTRRTGRRRSPPRSRRRSDARSTTGPVETDGAARAAADRRPGVTRGAGPRACHDGPDRARAPGPRGRSRRRLHAGS